MLPEAQVAANKAQFLLAQVTVALELLAEGGGLILQVDDLTSTHMLQLSYILACCFHEVRTYVFVYIVLSICVSCMYVYI